MADSFKGFLAQQLAESVSDTVYQKLIRYKNALEVDDSERCEIDANDEKNIKSDIESKLTAGWTEAEVYDHLKWSEYFDDYTHDEDTCLAKMSAIQKKVQARLK